MLVEFNWQPVGIGDKGELPAGEFVNPYGFGNNAFLLQVPYRSGNVIHFKRQVPQARCLGP